MPKKTLADVPCRDQRVLMRVDFNVPLDARGEVLDDRRIRMALPSINQVLTNGGKLILMSHLGRPRGEGPEPALSLKPAADRLARLLGESHRVQFVAGDCVGDAAVAAVHAMQPGDVVMLDNLRFHAEEQANDPEFSRRLASLADIYVNDAFGTAHRTHASMVIPPERRTA